MQARPERDTPQGAPEDPLGCDTQAVIQAVGTELAAFYSGVVREPPRDRLATLLQKRDREDPGRSHPADKDG